MPLVSDVMTRRPAGVPLDDTVRGAMDRLRAEEVDLLPVTREGAVVGAVRALALFRLYGEMPLADAVEPPPPSVQADAPVGIAAARMLESGARLLLVMRGEEWVGLLTERDLAASWGSVADPLTGLPWQDQLRRWAAAHLSRGREIAIIFLDLNGFGPFNKEYGHVLGDRMLQVAAAALRGGIQVESDSLCRYGGDEFVVATTRPLPQARALARTLQQALADTRLEGEAVSLSAAVGIAGGQRSGQRPGAHPSATLDDLINLASRASTRAKSLPDQCCAVHGDAMTSHERPARAGEVRTRLDGYRVEQRGEEVSASVSLRRGTTAGEGQAARPAGEVREALAEATVAALARFLPGCFTMEVAELYNCGAGTEGEVVGAAVVLTRPDGVRERLSGAAPVGPDQARSVIHAVLDATNRRLGYWFAAVEAAPVRAQLSARGPD